MSLIPWLERLPDVPRHVEARGLLLAGRGRIVGESPDGFFVADPDLGFVWASGRPDRTAVEALLDLEYGLHEVGVPLEHEEHFPGLLPGWVPHPATLHTHPDPGSVAAPAHATRLLGADHWPGIDLLPEELAAELRAVRTRTEIAAALAGELSVAFCYANACTETLWDVSVDTLEGHRRRGYAGACFAHLTHRMLEMGKRPVWGALDSNEASLGLARKLGFVPADRLVLFTPPHRD